MIRCALVTLLLAAGAASAATRSASRETDTPPANIVIVPPDSADPKFGEYVYVEELPEAVTKVPPSYPEAARRKGVDSTILVQALVGRDGTVEDTRIVQSIPMLDSAAVAAVRQWTFKPALSKGKPVAVWVAVPVRFTLRGQEAPPPDGRRRRPVPVPPRDPDGIVNPVPPTGPSQGRTDERYWAPPITVDVPYVGASDEAMPTEAFNLRLAAAGDSAWAQAPATIAVEFVGGAERECAHFSVQVDRTPERFDDAAVVVIRDGFLGDSIRGDRHRLTMRRADRIWKLTSASASRRCWKGRGHEDYSAEPCR